MIGKPADNPPSRTVKRRRCAHCHELFLSTGGSSCPKCVEHRRSNWTDKPQRPEPARKGP